MNRRPFQRDAAVHVTRSVVLAAGAWAWFVAQWLTNGVSEHVHAASPAPIAHHHGWSSPGMAVTGALMFALILAAVILHLAPGASPSATLPGGRTTTAAALVGISAYATLEIGEQLAQPEHQSPTTLLVLLVGLFVTASLVALAGVLAGAAISTIVFVTRGVIRATPAPQVSRAPRSGWAAPRPLTSHVHATSRRRRGPPPLTLHVA